MLPDLGALLDPVKLIARDAGREILAVSATEADVENKEDGSPVTRADRASHQAIVTGLSALQPTFPILSEEGELEAARRECGQADAYWLVDPLDGTKEFIAGHGDYTVNIALIERAEPVLGVIYVPALDDLYYAARDLGAWKRASDGSATRLECAGPGAICGVISRSHASRATDRFLEKLDAQRVLRRGSSVKICSVAAGEAHVYPRLGPTFLWDTAAGAVIARQAGCRIEDLAGNDLTYDCRQPLRHAGFVVYSPKAVHKADWMRAAEAAAQ